MSKKNLKRHDLLKKSLLVFEFQKVSHLWHCLPKILLLSQVWHISQINVHYPIIQENFTRDKNSYALNSWLSDCSLLAATQIWSQFVNVHHSHLWIYLNSKKEIDFRIMIEDRRRFDRCLTPMGTVPISVIYGWNNCYFDFYCIN